MNNNGGGKEGGEDDLGLDDSDNNIDALSLQSLLLSMQATHSQLRDFLRSVECVFSQETEGSFFCVDPKEAQRRLRRFKRGVRSVLRMQRIALGTYAVPRIAKKKVPKMFQCSGTPRKKTGDGNENPYLPIESPSCSPARVAAPAPPTFPVAYFSPARKHAKQEEAGGAFSFHQGSRYSTEAAASKGQAMKNDIEGAKDIHCIRWEIKVLNEIRDQLSRRVVACKAAPKMTFEDMREAMERVDRELNALHCVLVDEDQNENESDADASLSPFDRLVGKILQGPVPNSAGSGGGSIIVAPKASALQMPQPSSSPIASPSPVPTPSPLPSALSFDRKNIHDSDIVMTGCLDPLSPIPIKKSLETTPFRDENMFHAPHTAMASNIGQLPTPEGPSPYWHHSSALSGEGKPPLVPVKAMRSVQPVMPRRLRFMHSSPNKPSSQAMPLPNKLNLRESWKLKA